MTSNRFIRRLAHGLAMLTALVGLMIKLPLDGQQATEPGSAQYARRTPGTPTLSPEQATALALNDLEVTADGWRLRHPRHTAEFIPEGLSFRPLRGGPAWAWQLTFVGADSKPLPGVDMGMVRPTLAPNQPGAVVYPRGGLVEQYVARKDTLEQQFLIPQPLALGSANLVIAGRVTSPGAFEAGEDGWLWQTEEGAVRLGDVRVYDAQGRALAAAMTVTAGETQIVVNGAALQRAVYPVTIDPEIGAPDFRLSDMGPDGSTGHDAFEAAVAYNSINNEYLVVWRGDDDTGMLTQGEFEIFGQRVNAATGAEVAPNDFRISNMGPDGVTAFDASSPAVAYNSTNNEYLVVWQGDTLTGALGNDEFEIFGELVTASGVVTGTNDFRISDMGPDGVFTYTASLPAVAYNGANNEYLVVWQGDDNTAALVDGENEIFGQLVTASGVTTGTNDFRLSDMGPDGNAAFDALNPAAAYNTIDHEYLVVWFGDDATPPLVDNELEIFGQRLDAATGGEVGANDFRISNMGTDGVSGIDAEEPAVAYNGDTNQYLVVWQGDHLTDAQFEIFGQRVAADGTEVLTDFRISDMGADGDPTYDANAPAVAYDSANHQYLVVWRGDDNIPPLAADEFEIFGQQLSAATGAEVGANDFRLSEMGPNGVITTTADSPAVAYASLANAFLVVWDGDDDTPPLVDEENEIFGQRFSLIADLTIAKSDNPDPVNPGTALTYTLNITNTGPDLASSVTVTDILPSSATFVSASGLGWSCSQAGGVVTCVLSSLAVGAGPDIIITVTAPCTTGGITNTAGITSATMDSNAANNTATITTTLQPVTPVADLCIAKGVTPSPAEPGQAITYTLTYTNNSLTPFIGVLITDIVPITVTDLAYTNTGAVITPTGSVSYTWQVADLLPGQGGIITITGILSDGLNAGHTFTNTATITSTTPDLNTTNNLNSVGVTIANVAPTAGDDVASTPEDTSVSISVLTNDNDSNGDPLTMQAVGTPVSGTATISGTTEVVYTPTLNFNGTDTFTYTVSDGSLTDTALVTVTVTPVNDPPDAVDDTASTLEDSAVSIGVLSNDTSAPDTGETLSVSAVGTPISGTATLSGTTEVVYTPTLNFNGTDSFTYTVSDGVLTDTALVTVTVSPVNDPPVAGDDTASTLEDTAVSISVLSNDSIAPDTGETLSVSAVGAPVSGTAAISGTTQVVYTPTLNFDGTDTFTYTVSDGVLTDTALVTVTVTPVNDPPVAGDDTASTPEDTAVSISVLGNDSDVDGPSLSVVAVGAPVTGTTSISGTTHAVYTPTLNFNGMAVFTYTVSDGGLTDTGLVTVTVTPVNDPPTSDAGADQIVPVSALATLDGSASADPDGPPPLTYGWTQTGGVSVVLSSPTISQPTFSAPGSPTVLTFTLTVTDALGLSDPTPDEVVITIGDTAISGLAAANSSPTTLGNPTLFTATVTTGSNINYQWSFGDGITAIGATTSHTYSAGGVYTAVVTATNSVNGLTATTSVTINDTPLAANDAYTGTEDTTRTVAAPGVLANDTDTFGSPLTAVLASGPTTGTLTLSANGAFTYTPPLNFNGVVTFTYRANDGALNSNPATVALTFTPVNDLPTISNIPDQVVAAGSSTGPILFTVGDVDGDTLTVTGNSSNPALVPVANIVFAGSGANRGLSITPAAGQIGTTTITVTVNDGNGGLVADSFVLTVTGFKVYLPLVKR